MNRFVGLLALGLALLTGVADSPSAAGTGRSQPSGVKLRWQVPAARPDCPGMIGPVIAGSLVLTQDASGLIARNAATGRPVWRETSVFHDRRAYHIVVSGQTVVVTSSDSMCQVEGGDADGLVVAFDLATGRRRWLRSPSTDAAQVIVTRGVVVVSGNDYGTEPSVNAYRLADGRNLWSAGTGSDGRYTLWSAIPVGGDVLVAHYGEPSRVDAVTGQLRGSWPAEWTPLTTYRKWVLIGDSADWSTKAIRVADRGLAWSMDRVSNRVATDERRLYLGIGNSLEAYDAASGRPVWAVNLGARVGRPIQAGGRVYTPVAGRPIAVRDAVTGVRIPAGIPLPRISAVAGQRLFVADRGRLRAYDLDLQLVPLAQAGR